MPTRLSKFITTKQLASLIRKGQRVRAVYDWKKKGFISPAQRVEGKGPGHSDLWDFGALFWAMNLDELFEIGLTSDSKVFLRWDKNTEECKLDESSEIQRYLNDQKYDVVVQLLRGYDDRFEKRRSELYVTSTDEFLNIIERTATLKKRLVFRGGNGRVESAAILFGKQLREDAIKKWASVVIIESD
jgi:hypothetical protein